MAEALAFLAMLGFLAVFKESVDYWGPDGKGPLVHYMRPLEHVDGAKCTVCGKTIARTWVGVFPSQGGCCRNGERV